MNVRIIDEHYNIICIVQLQEIFKLKHDEQLYVTINDKKIPFKVMWNGGFVSLVKIDYIEKNDLNPDIEIHGLISNIYNFDELRKLVG